MNQGKVFFVDHYPFQFPVSLIGILNIILCITPNQGKYFLFRLHVIKVKTLSFIGALQRYNADFKHSKRQIFLS